jgi:hypothetical protein
MMGTLWPVLMKTVSTPRRACKRALGGPATAAAVTGSYVALCTMVGASMCRGPKEAHQ